MQVKNTTKLTSMLTVRGDAKLPRFHSALWFVGNVVGLGWLIGAGVRARAAAVFSRTIFDLYLDFIARARAGM